MVPVTRYTLLGTRYSVHVTRSTLLGLVTRYTLLGTRYSVHVTRSTLLGPRYLVPVTWYTLLGTSYLVHVTWTSDSMSARVITQVTFTNRIIYIT